MSAQKLITGSITKPPESRTSKNGNGFATATMRARDGNGWQYWSLIAFDETTVNDLIGLSEGESLSIQGELKAEIYERDGKYRVSLSCIVAKIMTNKRTKRD